MARKTNGMMPWTMTAVVIFAGIVCGQNLPEGLALITTTRKPTTLTTTMQTTTTMTSSTKASTTEKVSSTTLSSTTKIQITTIKIKKVVKRNTTEAFRGKPTMTPKIATKGRKGKDKKENKSKKNSRSKNKIRKKNNSKNNVRDTKKKGKKAKKKLKKVKKETRRLMRQTKSNLKKLKRSMRKRVRLEEKSYMKAFLKNCSMLLKSIKKEWKVLKKKGAKPSSFADEEEPANSYSVVQTMNNFGVDLAYSLREEKAKKKKKKEVLPISVDEINMEVSVVSTNEFPGYVFPDPSSKLNVTDTIRLPPGIFKNSAEGNGTIISIVYDAFYEMADQNATGNFGNATVNSKVLSTTVYPHPTDVLKEPVEIILTHLQRPNSTTPECVFWQVNQSEPTEGQWSTEGCIVAKSNSSHTVCHCNHLTDFAVLFRVSKTKKISEEHQQALTVVSLVGCFISAVCLMVTVLILMILRKLLRSTRNLLHLNLAAALLIANILFMVSGKVVSAQNACLAVSMCLFYFFLAAFFLMLGEGIYIWIMVAKAFSRNLKKWMYLCIGWGLPLIVVFVSFGILRRDIVAADYCWLSVKSGAIWAFVGPIVFIIVVNLCILIKVLCTAVEHHSDGSNFKISARLTLVLMPILGLTWIFGICAMNNKTLVFEYLFTIFNSFQGLFIFICYIVLNGEVKTEYQKMKARKEYSQSLQARSTQSTGETKDRRSRTGTQDGEAIAMVS